MNGNSRNSTTKSSYYCSYLCFLLSVPYFYQVNNNEMVALQREPSNPYDKNAIKVNNVNGNQVGHLKREIAAPLAYIMDNKLAQVEG